MKFTLTTLQGWAFGLAIGNGTNYGKSIYMSLIVFKWRISLEEK